MVDDEVTDDDIIQLDQIKFKCRHLILKAIESLYEDGIITCLPNGVKEAAAEEYSAISETSKASFMVSIRVCTDDRYGNLSSNFLVKVRKQLKPINNNDGVLDRSHGIQLVDRILVFIKDDSDVSNVAVSTRGDINFFIGSVGSKRLLRIEEYIRNNIKKRPPRSLDVSSALKLRSGRELTGAVDWQFRSIGTVLSVFDQKFGAPRQGSVVPSALGIFQLDDLLNVQFLSGLEEYSHVWIIYVFDCNQESSNLKPLVAPPKTDAKVGALASRSPHRPSPIGLTVARIIKVEGKRVYLSGIDIVDKTPVLDIKPYHPLDCVQSAIRTPDWVQETSAKKEPMPVIFNKRCLPSLAEICFYKLSDVGRFKELIGDKRLTFDQVIIKWDERRMDISKNKLGGRMPFRMNDTIDGFINLVNEVFSADPRPKYAVQVETLRLYTLVLDGVEVAAQFNQDHFEIIEFSGVHIVKKTI
eukprot:GHVH01017454.1.p1 GENE.GHVH01017454.1~~GHVH01017454.1.p1  ORF type:complete len:483 (-),score=60.41 GHVH01017454.1:192-1601(-)